MVEVLGLLIPALFILCLSPNTKVEAAGAPTELTLDVALVAPYDNISEYYIGSKTEMEVKISFPEATTSAVTIELLPSTNVTIMALGTVTVTPPGGGHVTITGSNDVVRHITDDSLGQKIQVSTRAVIDLGDVTGAASGSTIDDYTYVIVFEAFVVSVDGISDNHLHWVSAGVEYDNSNSIWVGQTQHTIRTGTQASTKTPSFTMQNVNEIKKTSVAPVTFEAFVPYPNSFIAVEAISLSTTDDHLRVVSLKCINPGTTTNFAFYGTEASGLTYINYPLLQQYSTDCTDPGGSRRLRVEVGNIPNKGSRDNTATGDADKLTFEAMVNMKSTAIENEDYPFGVGIEIDGSEVWVATINITAGIEDAIDFPIGNYVDNSTGTNTATISVGEGVITTVPITIPQRGMVTVTYQVVTTKSGGGDPGLMVSQAFVLSSGNNIECPTVTSTSAASTPGGLVDILNVTVTAANHGTNATTSGDANEDIVVIGIALASVVGYAADGSDYIATITSLGLAATHTDSITYTMSGVATYDSNTNHTFDLTTNCAENQVISEGSTFEMMLTITTERGSNPESLQIEFPIPANVTDGMFVVCGIEVVKLGRNLVCFNPTQLVNDANYTTLADGTHEYVAINVQPACNMGLFPEAEDDQLVLRIKTQYKAGVTIVKGEEYWFAIGSKYTSTQIWVAQYPVYGQPIYDLNGPAIVTDISVLDTPNVTFPGSYKLTRSFNGIDFDTLDIATTSSTNNGTHTTYKFGSPIMARKLGLITTNCEAVCGADYEFEFTSFKDYVDIFGDDNNAILDEIINVFDNDSSSCLNLPVQGQSPPVFWARINTTLLNINLQSFTISVEGNGVSCQRHGAEKVLQVSISYPVSSSVGRFHGDVKFCKNTNSNIGSPNSCDYTCMCPDTAECSEIIIFLANSNNGGSGPSWALCGLTASNI